MHKAIKKTDKDVKITFMKSVLILIIVLLLLSCSKSFPKGSSYMFAPEMLIKLEFNPSSIKLFDCISPDSCNAEPRQQYSVIETNFLSDSLVAVSVEVERFDNQDLPEEGRYKMIYLKLQGPEGKVAFLNEPKFSSSLEKLKSVGLVDFNRKIFLSFYSPNQIERFNRTRSFESLDSFELSNVQAAIHKSIEANKKNIANTVLQEREKALLLREIVNRELISAGINPKVKTSALSGVLSQKNM
jgi:hypothetical protein